MNCGTIQVSQTAQLGQLLTASRARLTMAAVGVPGRRSMPFRVDLDRLFQRQIYLERDLEQLRRALGQAQFGFAFWAVGVGAAALAALGAMIFKQHRATEEVETRMEIYNNLVRAGIDPDEASRRAFGDGGGLGGIMDKLLILGALATGLVLYLKLK